MTIKKIIKLLKYYEDEGINFPEFILASDYSGEISGLKNFSNEDITIFEFNNEKELDELYNKVMKG